MVLYRKERTPPSGDESGATAQDAGTAYTALIVSPWGGHWQQTSRSGDFFCPIDVPQSLVKSIVVAYI